MRFETRSSRGPSGSLRSPNVLRRAGEHESGRSASGMTGHRRTTRPSDQVHWVRRRNSSRSPVDGALIHLRADVNRTWSVSPLENTGGPSLRTRPRIGTYTHLYVGPLTNLPAPLDPLLREAADFEAAGVLIAPRGLGRLVDPYDGGIDAITATRALCPLSQSGDRLFVESVGGEFRVVDPVGSHQPRLELAQVEGVAGVASTEIFGFDMAPAVRGSPYVDQAPGESEVEECANFGSDDIFEGQHQPVLGVVRAVARALP